MFYAISFLEQYATTYISFPDTGTDRKQNSRGHGKEQAGALYRRVSLKTDFMQLRRYNLRIF